MATSMATTIDKRMCFENRGMSSKEPTPVRQSLLEGALDISRLRVPSSKNAMNYLNVPERSIT